MKVSLAWLQRFFADELPTAEKLVDALTFHVAEVEDETGSYIDVKVLPDRAAYMLCHRGVASELGAILGMPMKLDPLREPLPEWPTSKLLTVSVEDGGKCLRYMGAVVRGVKVGPAPEWLREALEAVGQRSINNVVDATNYVMLNIGQPLHAFDLDKLKKDGDSVAVAVRNARAGEKIMSLSGDDYTLADDVLLITDARADAPIGIAGVKGGKAAGITDETTDLVIESANFDGTLVRKASQKLKLWTDASQRFQNRPSPELAAYGMRDVLRLITDIAGGEVEGVADVYAEAAQAKPAPVSITLSKINAVLGTNYTPAHVARVFESLGFGYINEGDNFTVHPPFERRDIVIAEDLIEEVGRVIGYDTISSRPLPQAAVAQARYRGIERVKDFLIDRGFTEISTQTFAVQGDVYLANPLDQTHPALRTTLRENMKDALARAVNMAPRVLGPVKEVKLFEIGTTFISDAEYLTLCVGYQSVAGKHSAAVLAEAVSALSEELGIDMVIQSSGDTAETALAKEHLEKLGQGYEPKRVALGPYHTYSAYPFALRDIAVWTPAGTEEDEVEGIIVKEAGDLLARIDLFDRFEKKDENGDISRISFAFRLVFESSERTLSDDDMNPLMESITNALSSRSGYEVR
ncbi:MAG: phenylalanine--tRNA ligase subunit beta [Candidatus Pacebacteria bacterium]|nr:phenylalanine--tRNA ligase subunit beta [Candidatus Paceibacterota bacterium]